MAKGWLKTVFLTATLAFSPLLGERRTRLFEIDLPSEEEARRLFLEDDFERNIVFVTLNSNRSQFIMVDFSPDLKKVVAKELCDRLPSYVEFVNDLKLRRFIEPGSTYNQQAKELFERNLFTGFIRGHHSLERLSHGVEIGQDFRGIYCRLPQVKADIKQGKVDNYYALYQVFGTAAECMTVDLIGRMNDVHIRWIGMNGITEEVRERTFKKLTQETADEMVITFDEKTVVDPNDSSLKETTAGFGCYSKSASEYKPN